MSDRGRQMHRFIDQDLSPEERLAFLETLHRDGALRERLLDMERVLAGAAVLPRVTPPADFATQVLARLEPPPQKKPLDRLREWLTAPRALEWNPVGALAGACALLALAWMFNWGLQPSSSGGPAWQTAGPSRVASSVYVRLALMNPAAQSVTISGDFNGWNSQGIPLTKTASGLWTLTLPLKPGRYEYMYLVDGKWVTDPLASDFSPDGFGQENAVLDVREELRDRSSQEG